MAKNVLNHDFSEPLNGATAATVDVHAGDGNLTIDCLPAGEPALASGTLQYFEKQGLPVRTLAASSGRAALTLRSAGAGQHWLRLPWAACNGATEWQIHLNPTVACDLTAHSDGGNVRLNVAGMPVTRLSAETGGGNMDVVLPDHAANLSVTAQTGAGNVTLDVGSGLTGSSTITATSGAGSVVLRMPNDIAARVHATSGMGKVIVDSRFGKVDGSTYQSSDFETAANRVEITAKSGAGNVIVSAK